MRVSGRHYRTIWLADDGWSVMVIDQTRLPHSFATARLASLEDAAAAIERMIVRGAPLIGATAAYGMCLALRCDPSDRGVAEAGSRLRRSRPTASNLAWAVGRVHDVVNAVAPSQRAAAAYREAAAICDADVATNTAIGAHGLDLLRGLAKAKQAAPLNVLTHCNAGWLATVDGGTALAPVYHAHDAGLSLHVWVDETRPRLQGASLTAWELAQHGVPHTVIVDGAAGHLMRHGRVDICITGTDRTTSGGEVCNKIGTYHQALAASDNGVPFYAAVPGSSIDWTIEGRQIPIEEREAREVTHVRGLTADGAVVEVAVTPPGSAAANYAFDVTPARLVTGLITERGVCAASRAGLEGLYPERGNDRQ